MTASPDIASDFAAACDPVQLARRAGIEPYPYQVRLLRSQARQIILNWSRQAGKSTATSILPLHQALYVPGSLTLLVGPGERQATMLLDKCYDALGRIGWKPQKGEKDNVRYLGLANGSEVYALPGKEGTIRGFSGVALIVIDEASKAADSLYKAVRPMLAASGGRLILLSTPFGKRGFFYRAWTGEGTWERHEVPYTMVPHLSAEVLKEDRLAMSEQEFLQEYGCQFMDMEGQLFAGALLDRAFGGDLMPFLLPGEAPHGEDHERWIDPNLQPFSLPF